MAVFTYKALQANGTVTDGRVDAGGRRDAMRMIEDRGLTPLRLTETADASATPAPSKVKLSGFKMSLQSKRVSIRIA